MITMDWYQVISTSAAVLAAIAATTASVKSILNGRAANEITGKIEEIHVLINSRVDQLLATTAIAARQEGAEDVRKQMLVSTALAARQDGVTPVVPEVKG